MKDHPILFNDAMVLAILDGRKTQTRRVMKPQPLGNPARIVPFDGKRVFGCESNSGKVGIFSPSHYTCPYGSVGDTIPLYDEHNNEFSRATIKNIRVERLQDISRGDAVAEGFDGKSKYNLPVFNFAILWDEIYAKRGYGWDVNPFVWVIEFRRVA